VLYNYSGLVVPFTENDWFEKASSQRRKHKHAIK